MRGKIGVSRYAFGSSTNFHTMNKKLLFLFLWIAIWAFALVIFKAEAEAPDLSYDQKLDNWIERVRWEESRGKDMLVILDTNNKYSYGCLQYQMATWNHYSKKYNVEGEIMSCDAQKEVTRNIIKYEKDGWRNWWTTVTKKGVGKPPLPVL